MKRRDFVALLGGVAAAWPFRSRAQQGERMRRIGVLINLAENDPNGQGFMAAFRQGLQELGWVDGRNVRIDIRWGAGRNDRYPQYAAELVGVPPDIVLAATTPAVVALRAASRTVPIVFVSVVDPVGSGLVTSLPRPGGNATGFTVFEYAIAAKWLELLKGVAPHVTRAAV